MKINQKAVHFILQVLASCTTSWKQSQPPEIESKDPFVTLHLETHLATSLAGQIGHI